MISVIIPALNEEGAIGATVTDLARVLTAANLVPHEIIVVDDGSSDGTAKAAALFNRPRREIARSTEVCSFCVKRCLIEVLLLSPGYVV